MPEFLPNVLDALRQPLESGETVIARANHRIAYPSRIQLIAAMNPCKCGTSSAGETCKRGPRCASDYQARISGPLLDRIDLQIEVPSVSAADLVLPPPLEGSAEVRARVAAARDRPRERDGRRGAERVGDPMPDVEIELSEFIQDPFGTLARARRSGWLVEMLAGVMAVRHEAVRELLGDARLAANFMLSRDCQVFYTKFGRLPTRADVETNPPGIIKQVEARKVVRTQFSQAEEKRLRQTFETLLRKR